MAATVCGTRFRDSQLAQDQPCPAHFPSLPGNNYRICFSHCGKNLKRAVSLHQCKKRRRTARSFNMTEFNWQGRKDSSLELSILMPCLNEARTVGMCVTKALAYLAHRNVKGEVVVADNGSTDGSQAIAASLGARVVPVPSRGYGSALRAGIDAARGKFVIMGDSDDSYDFGNLDPFLSKLREGYHLVMGNRFHGGIKQGAMSPLHRYLGNPILTAIGRLFFHSGVGDFHCGLRGFDRDAIRDLNLDAPGMEFASEMVVKATISKLRIIDVPTTLSPDGRDHPSHLRSWHDGWRHLRLLLLFSPRWLFLYPGAVIFVVGLAGTLMLFTRDVVLGGIEFAEHTMVITAAAINVGFEAMLFWAIANTIAIQRGLLPRDARLQRLRQAVPLERGLVLGAALIMVGSVAFVAALSEWFGVGFGPLVGGKTLRLVIISGATAVLGTQILYGSFFLYVLEYYAEPVRRKPLSQPAPSVTLG
jgi:glycosyltransferase involved in cell wall biosynthesis